METGAYESVAEKRIRQLELRVRELEHIITYSVERIEDFGSSRSLDLSILIAEHDRIKARK